MGQQQRNDYSIMPVASLALVQWTEVMLDRLVQENHLPHHLIALIGSERSGLQCDPNTVKKVVQSLISLGFASANACQPGLLYYDKFFLHPLLRDTHAFYVKESSDFLAHSGNGVMDYVHKAAIRLTQEEFRAHSYLHPSSVDIYMTSCCDALVGTPSSILRDEFKRQLARSADADIQSLYKLFIRLPNGTELLKDDFYDHIQKEGTSAIASLVNGEGEADAVAYINVIGSMHERYSSMVRTRFDGNRVFSSCVDKVSIFD